MGGIGAEWAWHRPWYAPYTPAAFFDVDTARARSGDRSWGYNNFGAAYVGHEALGDLLRGGFVQGRRQLRGPVIVSGAYGGEDYDGNARREHPLTFDFMFFFPRASRFQVYTLVGGGFSFARVDTDGRWDDDWDDGSYDERYAYIGGQLGLGFEWRISPVFALSADVRGFLRTRIDGDRDTNPEFVARDGRTTNTSAGALGTLGMHFYF